MTDGYVMGAVSRRLPPGTSAIKEAADGAHAGFLSSHWLNDGATYSDGDGMNVVTNVLALELQGGAMTKLPVIKTTAVFTGECRSLSRVELDKAFIAGLKVDSAAKSMEAR